MLAHQAAGLHHYIGTGNPTFPFFRVYPIFSIFRVVDKGVGDREEGVMWFCLFFKGGRGDVSRPIQKLCFEDNFYFLILKPFLNTLVVT